MDEILFLLMIMIIWFVYYLLVYIYDKTYTEKRNNYDSLVIVHQNCYSFNAKHIYLIKLYYGKPPKKFFFWTNITLDFLDDKQQTYSTINIPSKVLFDSHSHVYSQNSKKKEKFMAFILQTKISLKQTKTLRVKHDNRFADLFVYRIKIIDLMSKDTFNIMINSHIKFLPPGAHPMVQTYNCTSGLKNKTDIKPSPYLNFANILLFFFVGIHAIMFHIQYKIIDNLMAIKAEENTLFDVSLSSLFSALFGSILVTVLLFVYYLVVKHFYSKFRGIGCVWVFEKTYRWSAVIMAIILGLLATARRQIHWPDTYQDYENRNKLKLLALALAIIVYSVAFFTIVIISQYLGFMKKPEQYELESEDEVSSKPDIATNQPVVRSDSNVTFMPVFDSTHDSQPPNKNEEKPIEDKLRVRPTFASVASDFQTNSWIHFPLHSNFRVIKMFQTNYKFMIYDNAMNSIWPDFGQHSASEINSTIFYLVFID